MHIISIEIEQKQENLPGEQLLRWLTKHILKYWNTITARNKRNILNWERQENHYNLGIYAYIFLGSIMLWCLFLSVFNFTPVSNVLSSLLQFVKYLSILSCKPLENQQSRDASDLQSEQNFLRRHCLNCSSPCWTSGNGINFSFKLKEYQRAHVHTANA